MVNFYAPDSVPAKFTDRTFYQHNAERHADAHDGRGERARSAPASRASSSAATGPVAVLLPARGVSAIDKAGQPFDDPAARRALHDAIRAGLRGRGRSIELDLHINDPAFADAAAQKLLELMHSVSTSARSSTARSRHQRRANAEEQAAEGQSPSGNELTTQVTAILKRFREQIARGEPIIGGGAGTGLSAMSEEAGGIDLLIVYNSGRYRMAGRGSSAGLLAYGNANQIVKEMAYEVLPVVKRNAGARRRQRHRSVHHSEALSRGAAHAGVRRHPELPHGRPVRRRHAAGVRGNGHELPARGRHHPARATARPVDDAVRVQPVRSRAHGRCRRRSDRRAHGGHDRRIDRREELEDTR